MFPDHWQPHGFRWQLPGMPEQFFGDRFLCFGLATAPAVFNKIFCAIARMVQRSGHRIVSYLDDFVGGSVVVGLL